MSTVMDNPAAVLEARMNDYKNYPSLPGETYHSRRRRLEGMIDNEIRAAGGDPYARDPRVHDGSQDGGALVTSSLASAELPAGEQTATGASIKDDEAARAQRRAQTDAERSGEVGERAEVPFKGHPPALPHKDDIPQEVLDHGDKAGRPLVLSPASGTSAEAAAGKIGEPAKTEPAPERRVGGDLQMETGGDSAADEKARVRASLLNQIEAEEQRTDHPPDQELLSKLREELAALDKNEAGTGASIDTSAVRPV